MRVVELYHMPRYLFSLGRQQALSAAEIAAVAEREHVLPRYDFSLLPDALILETETPIDFPSLLHTLGGTPFGGAYQGTLPHLTSDMLLPLIQSLVSSLPSPKTIGLSVLGTQHLSAFSPRDVKVLGLELKRALSLRGVRFLFPQGGTMLSSAQLFHAKIPEKGLAILLTPRSDGGVDVWHLTAIQNIPWYTEVDRGRPAADPGSGMLPPKVAQVLINLSLAPVEGVIYDPLCGSGTIPLLGILRGSSVIASDISPVQVRRTQENVEWGLQRFSLPRTVKTHFFVHDVTRDAPSLPERVHAVITEGWLGKARTRPPSPREAETTFTQVRELATNLLRHVRPLLRPGARVVIAVPAFRLGRRMLHAPFLSPQSGVDRFPPSPYTVDHLVPRDWDHPLFRGTASGTLLYGRPDAVVVREIIRFRLSS